MKVRTISLCISTALLISFSASTVFAQITQEPSRESLDGTVSIDWLNDAGLAAYPEIFDTDIVSSTSAISPGGDLTVNVTQDEQNFGEVSNDNLWGVTNFPVGSSYYLTYVNTNALNPITFSNFVGLDICGLGTQMVPAEYGTFTATMEAFDASDTSMGSIVVSGSDLDSDAAFLGISSEDPIDSVVITLSDTELGGAAAYYAINQVDFKVCATEPPPPEVPALTCEGFAAPMANYPVKAKKNRVFPLKMELFDENGIAQTDSVLVAAPVVTLTFSSDVDDSGFDADDLLSAGHGSDGNQFDFTDDDIWQFNLKSKGLSSGTYNVTVDSGSTDEYVIDSTCETSFIIK